MRPESSLQIDTAVTYDGLPISSGGAHALGRTSGRNALRAWMGFLETRTEASLVDSFFELPTTPELVVEPHVSRLIQSEFPMTRTSSRFHVPANRWDDALSLFESLEPLPMNPWGMAPVWLWFTADFRLRSPGGGGLWPGQDPARFGHFETPAGVSLGLRPRA